MLMSAYRLVHSFHMMLTLRPSLRAIVRNTLSNGTPGFASAFTTAARSRFCQINTKVITTNSTLFTRTSSDEVVPTPQLNDALTRARTLYGAGMGFASLSILAAVVRATVGFRWDEDGDMAEALAAIDAD